MPSRFVLVPADNPFNRGEVPTAKVLMARMALRRHAAKAATAVVPPGGGAMASMASVATAHGLSAAALKNAESNGPRLPSVRVVKRLPEDNGSILLELDEEDRLALQREYPGARVVPEGEACMAFMSLVLQELATMTTTSRKPPIKLLVRVRDAKKRVLAHTDVQCIFDSKTSPPTGATSKTDGKGMATLLVPTQFRKVDIVVNPQHSVWPAERESIVVGKRSTIVDIVCPRIVDANDCARALYKEVKSTAGENVSVAVIDGGAGPHASLNIAGGANLADDARPKDFSDNGIGHGTHVAGLIAAQSTNGWRGGFAPGVTLRMYRVYKDNDTRCGSFVIAEAIRKAVDDGADLINLSLTLSNDQPEITRELRRARAMGVSIIAAAGNAGGAVLFPARLSGVLAVSAMGIVGCAPAGSNVDLACLPKPLGKDHNHRIADFSCFGPEIDLIGPGVGIVSLFPKEKRAIMSGTSMAAPVVTGRIANALSAHPEILQQPRGQARSDAINRLAMHSVRNLGFFAKYQGQGLPE